MAIPPKDTIGSVAKTIARLKEKVAKSQIDHPELDYLANVAMALFDFIWYLGIEAATADATDNIADPIEMEHIESFVDRFMKTSSYVRKAR